MFIRSKIAKGTEYYQVVHGYRDESGRVRQRTVASLGRCPTVEDAIKAEKKKLSKLRRDRGRFIGQQYSWGLKRAEQLDRLIERSEAKVALLGSIIDGSYRLVDTTDETSDSDYVRTAEKVA